MRVNPQGTQDIVSHTQASSPTENVVEHCTGSFFRFLIKHQFRNAYKHSFSYNWYKIGCFTRWLPGKQNVILCFDIGYELQFRILESLHNSIGASFGDPYIVHTTIVQEVGILFDTSVWDLRHLVREIEKVGMAWPIAEVSRADLFQTRATVLPEEIDFPRFHELSRHVLHSSETLTVASETLKSMVEEHESFIQSRLRQNVAVDRTSKKIQGTLKYQTSLFRCFKERSIALEKRLQNEIDLAYNLVAQSDSRTSVGIGAAAQRDSAAMKTIAVMTLTFLPGTFIASLFSMSFFDRTTNTQTQQAHIYATEDFWKYWAVTVPLTVVIVALWFLWHHDYAKRYAASKK
ncbi:MAG: hypothetical protein M1818_005605 [Claussenomyces sp. TS43310]|nr:MAG: hypothetical protein M1818_005605 [Claussenomyces sp. TS43310]